MHHMYVKEDALASAKWRQKPKLVISAQQRKSSWTAVFWVVTHFPLSFSSFVAPLVITVPEILFCNNSIRSSRQLHEFILAKKEKKNLWRGSYRFMVFTRAVCNLQFWSDKNWIELQNCLCKHMLKPLSFYGFAKCSFITSDTVVRGSSTSDQIYAN